MDVHNDHAHSCLEANGFRVVPIEESNEERADFLVSDEHATYLVEVKGKDISNEYRTMIVDAETQGMASIERTMAYRNRLDGIVRKANSQLENTPAPNCVFRILWASCLRGDEDFIHEEFKHTLYGTQELAVFYNNGKAAPSSLPCFYFNHSSFIRYRGVDGVILTGPQSGHLCVNQFSQNLGLFRQCRMYNLFPKSAVVDPLILQKSGRALALPTVFDRTDAKAKWQFLLDNYGYMTTPMNVCHFRGGISVPLLPHGKVQTTAR